jgi:hypothetical protein
LVQSSEFEVEDELELNELRAPRAELDAVEVFTPSEELADGRIEPKGEERRSTEDVELKVADDEPYTFPGELELNEVNTLEPALVTRIEVAKVELAYGAPVELEI